MIEQAHTSYSCSNIIWASDRSERSKRAHSLFMSIEISYIYNYVVRVSCTRFPRILRKKYLNFIVYSGYPGILMFAEVRVFNVVFSLIERVKRAHSLFMSIEISDNYIYYSIYYTRQSEIWPDISRAMVPPILLFFCCCLLICIEYT